MNKALRLAMGTVFLLVPFVNAFSQTQTDSSFVRQVSNRAVSYYIGALKQEAPVFNGRIYRAYPYRLDNGHSYFREQALVNGTLVYEGKIYQDVQLLYDLVRDEVALSNFDHSFMLIAQAAKVDGFQIHGHYFTHIKKLPPKSGLPSPGYYDQLYKGKIELLARRRKSIKESAGATKIERMVSESTRYYLLKDSVYHPVSSRRSLLKVLKQPGKSGTINQQFIKTNRLQFRTNKEMALINLVKFYDTSSQ
ncbi:hypothetical protein [Pedobacter sp. SYSU D00535]|uniref:hypothetical protein n=1 Tax=Pedobacter sp. SYSU D00535 TaxID=2810308 RepID=UPI001A9701A7|nr:hypothetical protein [Pedobacter sp. SYSU D00535]